MLNSSPGNLKQRWLPALTKQVRRHERLKQERGLLPRTRQHSEHIFGLCAFDKTTNDDSSNEKHSHLNLLCACFALHLGLSITCQSHCHEMRKVTVTGSNQFSSPTIVWKKESFPGEVRSKHVFHGNVETNFVWYVAHIGELSTAVISLEIDDTWLTKAVGSEILALVVAQLASFASHIPPRVQPVKCREKRIITVMNRTTNQPQPQQQHQQHTVVTLFWKTIPNSTWRR